MQQPYFERSCLLKYMLDLKTLACHVSLVKDDKKLHVNFDAALTVFGVRLKKFQLLIPTPLKATYLREIDNSRS